MSRSRTVRPGASGMDKVRTQFLTALHTGRLHPGDRVPSIRRLADMTGMNRKTIHRAYARLAKDGLLDIRKGSGTFLAEKREGSNGSLAASDLLAAINRCRSEASTLGLQPAVFARFVHLYLGDGLRGLPAAVVECNHEQAGLIVRELRRGLGLAARSVLLSELGPEPRALLDGVRTVVTTDCHRDEVERLVGDLGYAVYRVALDAEYARTMIEHARRAPLVMVVRDAAYGAVFRRLLEQLDTPRAVIDRVHVVEPALARAAFRRLAADAASVYVSPTVEPEMVGKVPARLARVEVRRHLDQPAFERLRSRLALELALDARNH